MLSTELETTLNKAFKKARARNHQYLTLEHLLLNLLDNASAKEVLLACGADLEELRKRLKDFIRNTATLIPEGDSDQDIDTEPSYVFQRVMQRSIINVKNSSQKQKVTGANVLIALYGEPDSQAVHFLEAQQINRIDVANYVNDGTKKQLLAKVDYDANMNFKDAAGPRELDVFATNLNILASQGKIDPLIGREDEVDRLIQILARRRKNNPLLVGDAGVGKTAIVEGLALRIIEGKVPEEISNAVVYSLDLGDLLAGAKYRGEFEERLKTLLRQIQAKSHAILFIDEMHMLMDAGSNGSMNAANMVKPVLASGTIRCIGSTTHDEYRKFIESDAALARRFQKIDIKEPTAEQTYKILKGLRAHFEKHHAVKYSDAVLKAAVDLSKKHITDRFFPDKAIDVIDEAGARQKLLPKEKRRKNITINDIEDIIISVARIPAKRVTTSELDALQNLERNLKMLVYGQDKPIEMLASSVKLARAGLGDPNKPWGSFLFAGPTGVGKTEVAKQLADQLGVELLRYDMSEYMERHSVSKLIGAPPGYVGYDSGGKLTESVMKNPHSVVLLDEIEKAHPDIYNILLQVMDNGELTDGRGRTANFRNVIIIVTTNAGAEAGSKSSIGFTEQDNTSDKLAEINREFSPEFRNRLDGIVVFNPLSMENIKSVVNKFIAQLQGLLDEKGVSLELDDKAYNWLAEHGYDKALGARPMARIIQEHIKKPLAEKILFGSLSAGGVAKVSVADDKIVFL